MAKTLLDQYEEWKQKKQKEEQQASQPKYTIPDSGSMLEQYQAYKQQRQAYEQKAISSKRINNPSHLGNVMIAGAVQNTQKKQAEAGRIAKEEEARRVKQEEKQSWNDYVQRLTDQYMPVRPDTIPQVDITKKYGPSSSQNTGRQWAGATVTDAPIGFNAPGFTDLSGSGASYKLSNEPIDEAERDRREREERERADREAYQAALERANLGRGGKLNESSGRGGDLNLPSTGRGGALENNPANGWDYDANRAQDLRRVEQEDELANKYQLPSNGRGGRIVSDKVALEGALETADRERAEFAQRDMQGAKERAAVLERNLSVEDLQAKRAAAEKDIEQYNKVLEWVPSPQNVEAYQNYLAAQTQKKAAQEGIEQIDTFTLIKQLKDQASKETDPFELADINSKLQAAEYKYKWSTMDPEERAKTWVWQRVERGFRNFNRAYYGLTTDFIADILGIDRLEVSKQNQKQLDVISKEIAYQAQSASAIEGGMGDILTMAVENLPNIAMSLMGGGGLGVAANAAMDLKTAAAPFVTKFLGSLTTMLKNPMFWNSFIRSAGGNYVDEHDVKGNDPIVSLTAASIKGFLDSAIEVGGGIETGEIKPLGPASIIQSGFEEMGEELFQGPVASAYDFSQSGKGADTKLEDIISWDNPNAIISGKQMAQEGIMGFAGGAALSGMQQAGVAAAGAVKGQDLSAEPRSEYNYPEANIDQQIAKKEAEIAKKESEAYEAAARERMDFETRDSEAGKKYAELVNLVNESFPEDSETKAKIAEVVTIDTKRMTEIATNAMQELRARMQAEPTPETLKLSETLTQTVEGIFAGMQTDRAAITDKYTAGLDEAVKSEIKGKNDVTYAKGYGIAHALGAIGVPLDTIAKVKSVSTLQETAKQAADQGQAKWEAALPQLKTKAADLQKALPKPGQGGVTYRSNVKQEALSTLQRDQIGLLEKIAKPLGYNFVMMEFDKDAQGNYVTDKGQVAPNGYFRDTDGTIYIDVNAGKTAGRMVDDTIIPLTAGHELGHYLKATSPELFRAYSAAVVEELVSKGTDIDAMIAKQIGRGKLREITVESALEEMIMESGAMILSNSQAAQKMAVTNPGLFQKIAEWVKDFVDSIRKAFSRVDATPEARAIMQTVNGALKYSDTIINLWDTMALKEAQGRADVKPAVVARRDVQAVAKEAAGKKTAYTSDGQAVDYHYELVPVGSLIPSNLETSLEPNPDYPQELQPRDRTRAASQQQVEEIANKLNPALLGESADVGTGAPFIGPDMVVESGNGRVLAITRAMRQGKGLTYTQWLKDNAGRFGLDPAKIDNASVLVRVRDTDVNRPEFVQKANESQVATYSDSESAVSDAKKVTPAMLEMANMDSGDINSAGNSSFVASFISKVVPVAERGRMMDASGKLSKSGENRVRTALFQMAYEDGYLTEQMAEASDDTSKNILKAMTAVAPRLALMNDAMKKGTLSDYPIGQAIAEAYRIVQRQKRLGVSVDRYINQQSLVRQDTPAHWMLLEMFNENRNAPNRMTDALNSILNAAERQGNPNQMLMPGLEAERPSVEGIVREGLNRYGEEQMAASERDTLKFQMREPVEETAKLIAVHNLNEAQLLSSVELGGFAMPSIAVIKAGQPHDRYGDISIVFGKETIDPENYGNKVYGGDAWTPTFPQIDYEISEEAAAGIRKNVSSLLGPVYKDMRPGLDDDNMQDVINRAGGDPVKAYEDNNALKAAYLRDIGENFTPRYSEPDYGSEFGNDAVKYIADRMGDKVKEALGGPGPKFMSIEPDIRKALNGMTNGKFGGDVYAQPFGFGQIDRLARAVAQYMNSKGVMRLDTTETARDIREAMKEGNHETGYKAWLKGLFNGIIEKSGIRNNAEIFTPSGNRRSFDALHWSVTLENIVRSMKSQDKKGVGSMGGGGLFGVSTKNYNSLSDIRKDIGRLKQMDKEQYQAKRGEFMDRISELANEIAPKGERNRFIALDRASEVLTEAARKGTTAGIQRVLNGYKDYYNIREDTAKKLYQLMSDISRMPTEYFEAKPERAVGFDEVRAVIIPDTASDALKNALDNMSATVIEYKAEDNADRLKALNSPELDGVKFQERDSDDAPLTAEQIEYFKDSKVRDAQGRLQVAYHATDDEFYTFQSGNWAKLIYFALDEKSAKKAARGKKNIVPVYLNMVNPVNTLETAVPWYEAEKKALPKGNDGIYVQDEAGISIAVNSPEQIKSTTNLTPTSSPDIRYQERDTQYLAAVESGDMDTAQKMVDEAAKAAGYTIRAYHGTPNYQVNKQFGTSVADIHKLLYPNEKTLNPDAETFSDEYNRFWKFERWLKYNVDKTNVIPDNLKYLFKKGVTEPFTVFDKSRNGESTGAYDARRGFFFTEDEAFANRFRNTYSYDRFTGVVTKKTSGEGTLLSVYIKPGNVLDLTKERSADASKLRQMSDDITGYDTVINKVKWNPDLQKQKTRVTTEIMVTNPSNIKLTSPVTYDDAGNPIPLSQRFTDSNDIRYQERDLDYRTKRDILAGAFDSVAKTEGEKRNLKEYKNMIGALNRMEEEARGLRQANTAEWKKAEPDKAKVNENKKRIFEIEKRIFSMDKKLIQMQNAAPLRNVLLRQKREFERTAVDKYKGKRDLNDLNAQLNKRIERVTNMAMQYAARPTKKKHAPDTHLPLINGVLSVFNMATVDKQGNARPSYRAERWQDGLSRLGMAVQNLDQQNQKNQEGSQTTLLFEAGLQERIARLIGKYGNDIHVLNLPAEDKTAVIEITESVMGSVLNENKKFHDARVKTVEEWGGAFIDDGEKMRQLKLHGNFVDRIKNTANFDMADAFTFFESLGEGGREVLETLYYESFPKHVKNIQAAREFFEKMNQKYEAYGIKTWGGKKSAVRDYKVASGTLSMTPAQVMYLYMLEKRDQAKPHIYEGGVRVKKTVVKEKGKSVVKWQINSMSVTPAEVKAMTDSLTNEQRKAAEEIGKFMTGTTAEWVNEAHQKLYGYTKAHDPNYMPIVSDRQNILTQDPSREDSAYALLNIGATKDLVQGANNALIIDDIFDVAFKHASDMALYNAYALSVADTMNWLNYKRIVKGEDGKMRMDTVKKTLERLTGESGEKYILNLIKAINGQRNPNVASGFAGFLNSAIGKFKASAVGANVRVVLQQHSSYIRAAAMMNPASMAAAYLKSPKRGMQMARKYSAIAAWKREGYFDMNVGPQMSELISGRSTTAGKIREVAMKPAGFADDFTMGVLWNAAEIEVGKTYKGDKHSEAFYAAVGDYLTRVIDRTQVVDTVFHRSQIMRDKDGLIKITTNFMSEPIKTYNLFLNAIKTGDPKTIARVGTVALTGFIVTAMAAGFSDALRDKDKEKGWQGYWESWMKKVVGIGGNFFESNVWDNMNPLNMIPFGKDVYSIAGGYSPSRPDLQAAQRAFWAVNDWVKFFQGEDKELYKLIYNTANAISTASGIPISNVMRDVKSIYDTLDPRVVVGDEVKVTYQRFADALANGEEEKALAYYNALIDSGRDSVTIRTQAMQRYKDEETVIAASEAKKAGDYAAYEKAIDQAVKDGIPRDMAIKAADGLSTEKAEKTKPERAKTIDEVKKAVAYDDTYTYKSNDLMAVIEKGDNVTAKKIIDKMLKEGRKKDAISGSISSHFKPIYLEAYKKGQASNLKAKLLTMYALLGYDRNDKSKDIDAWLKQK